MASSATETPFYMAVTAFSATETPFSTTVTITEAQKDVTDVEEVISLSQQGAAAMRKAAASAGKEKTVPFPDETSPTIAAAQ
ncbi:MAG: hypothetical protein NT105_09350 [Verrucomicrobia bacterium]|nr:hypothetical protein [Verrucomicrobiota bacterium]